MFLFVNVDRKKELLKNFEKWSKKTFIEWFKNQDEICEKYMKNFERGIDEDDEFVDIGAYAHESALKSWFRIKDGEDRKHVLKCLKHLIAGQENVIEDQKEQGVQIDQNFLFCWLSG